MSLSFFLYSIVLKVSLAQLIAAMCCAKLSFVLTNKKINQWQTKAGKSLP